MAKKQIEPYKEEELLKNKVIEINIISNRPTKYMHEYQVWSGHHGEYIKDFFFTTTPR